MKVRALTAASFVSVGLCFGASAQPAADQPMQEKFLLRHVYAPGEYRIAVNTTSSETTETPGGRMPPSTAVNDMTIRVSVRPPAADGEREFVLRCESYRMGIVAAGRTMKFDSADPAEEGQDPNLAVAARALMSMNIVVRLDAQGEVKSMTGSDEVWNKLADENPGNPWIAQLKESMGAEFCKNLLRPDKGVFTDAPVAVGDEWRIAEEQTIPFLGDVSMTNDCVFKKLETTERQSPLALVEIKGGFRIPEERKITVGNGIPATITSGEYAYESALRFDVERKLIVAGMNRVRGGMKMTLSLPDGKKMPIETNQDVTSQLTCKRVEDDEAPNAERNPVDDAGAPAVAPLTPAPQAAPR